MEIVGDTPLPIEFHLYTLDEAIEMLKRCNPLIVDAPEEGNTTLLNNGSQQAVQSIRGAKEER